MRKVYILVLVGLVSVVIGCKKSVMDCTYVVKPYVEDTLGAKELLAEGAYAYVFFADTAQWWPKSLWADAEAGIITSRTGIETKKFDMKIELNERGILEIGPLTTVTAIIMVCDPVNRMFAWRQAELTENLEYIFVNVRFRPYVTKKEYMESRWNMVSEFAPDPPAPEPDPDPTPEPDPDPKPEPEPKPEPTPQS